VSALSPPLPVPALQATPPPEKPRPIARSRKANPAPVVPQAGPAKVRSAAAPASAASRNAESTTGAPTAPKTGTGAGVQQVSRPKPRPTKHHSPALDGAPLPPRSLLPEHPAGPGLPALTGELKLLLDGDPVQVLVRFRPYPRARRSEPPGSERTREEEITPQCASTGAHTREAVLGATSEGVYTVTLEAGSGRRARVGVTLTLYEGSPRERKVHLGRRSVTGSSTLFKVLMPEGVLWDDDSAFTGGMEDSDSEIKFNANSGLFWREFRR